MEPIENLDHDWSQIVDQQGNQLATAGHYFRLSRALTQEELQHIGRGGTCLACHQEIPAESLAVGLLHHVAKYTGQTPKTTEQHSRLLHKIVLLSAWAQTLAVLATTACILGRFRWQCHRRKLARNGSR